MTPAWLPPALAVAGFACGALLGWVGSGIGRQLAGAAFGLLLGAALLLWAVEDFTRGSVRARRLRVRRTERPRLFLFVLLLKLVLPGAGMVCVGLWFLLVGGAR